MTGSGSLTNISVVQSTGEWEIYCTATAAANQSMTVFVDADTADVIRYIIVEAKGGSTATVNLTVRAVGANGKVVRVENIFPDTISNPGNDAEFRINAIATSTSGTTEANIGEDGTAPGGYIGANAIVGLTAAKSVTATVEILPPISTGPSLRIIPIVEALNGDILGDLYNPYGSINVIRASNGRIGPATPSSTIPLIYATGEIQSMTAQSINADTVVTGTTAINCQCLQRIACTNGSLMGTVTAQSLGANAHTTTNSDGLYVTNGKIDADVFIGGNVRGGLGVDGTFSGDRLGANRTVFIGAGLQPNAPVTITGTVAGQIILNRNNSSQVWGSSSPVTINGVQLTPDSEFSYPETPSQIGGGAVGMAPFRLYASDCDPPRPAPQGALTAATTHTSLVPRSFDGATKPVVMRFYGPIRRLSSGAPYSWSASDIKLECIPLSNALNPCSYTGGWLTITSNLAVAGPTNSDPGIASRTLALGCVSGSRLSPGVYRVTFPGVRCAEVVGNPLVIPPQYCPNNDPDDPNGNDPDSTRAYYFRVGPDCDDDGTDDSIQVPSPTGACATGCADYDTANGVEVADIFTFLNEWMAGCCSTCHPATGSGCVNNADFNGNGTLEVQDIFDFLNSWFLGDTLCP